jgi:subtilisin family serine protease
MLDPATASAPTPAPGYLVLFSRADDAWPQVEHMTGAVRSASTRSAASTAEILPPRTLGGARIHVYSRLGVAAMDLSPDEHAALESGGATIVENIVMRLPDTHSGDETKALRANGPLHSTATAWGISAIGADTAPHTGRGIRIAVIDTGIDLAHPDFQGAVVAQRSFVPGVASAQDDHGHGTHVAGTIGARARSGSPRYSVAPECDLVVAKALNRDGSGYAQWIVDAMNWAALEENAVVLNLSLGGSRAHGAPYRKFYEEVAERLLDDGVLMIAAAGNDSNRPHIVAPIGDPAACPSVDAVVAVDHGLVIANFSCEGDAVAVPDHSAPGVDIYSAWIRGGYATLSGTSMAAPHVAGVAAQLAQSTGSRGATLRSGLRHLSSLRSLGTVSVYGAGLISCPP